MRLVLVILLAVAAPAYANVSQKNFPGMRAGEPAGIEQIAIEHETLVFDLRDRAHVTATYQLDNKTTEPVTEELVFVSGMSRIGGTEVRFDGAVIAGKSVSPAQAEKFPAAWSPPLTTPSLDGGEPVGFASENPTSIEFTLTIPPGKHTLAVAYDVLPAMTRSHGGPTRLYQIGYVLSPARDWGSFGTLDVTVEAPAGWQIATSPPLTRTGNTLRGQFTGLPQDTIGISMAARTGSMYMVAKIALPLLVLLVLIGGGYALYQIGRARGRSAAIAPSGLLAFGTSVLWAIAIAFAGGFYAVSEIGIPAGESASHGYAALPGIALTVLGTLLALPIGFAIVRAGIRREAPKIETPE